MDASARAQFQAACRRALEAVADGIERDARRLVPVDTGELRASVRRDPVVGDTVSVRATAPHALFVELGTDDTPAQPFLRPALYQRRDPRTGGV